MSVRSHRWWWCTRWKRTGWFHPFRPLLLCLGQILKGCIMVQLWIKHSNVTFSKFGLRKLWFKAVAESQKIPISGSTRAWSLSAFQDNLIWESKCCQSCRFQRNSAQEMPKSWRGDLRGSPTDPDLPGFAGLSFRPSLLTILTSCQILPRTPPVWAFPKHGLDLNTPTCLKPENRKGCCRNYHHNRHIQQRE